MTMTDYEDYENNLAFPPTTDRTQSNDELVEKIEKLDWWLDRKSNYIAKLEKKLLIAKMTLKKIAYNEDVGQSRSIAYKGLQKMRELD